MTVHSWQNLGIAMRVRQLSRELFPPDTPDLGRATCGGSPARGGGRKRTSRTRLAAAAAKGLIEPTRRCRAQIGARMTQTVSPRPGRPSRVHDAPALRACRLGGPCRVSVSGHDARSSLPLMRERPHGAKRDSHALRTILGCIIHTWRLMILRRRGCATSRCWQSRRAQLGPAVARLGRESHS